MAVNGRIASPPPLALGTTPIRYIEVPGTENYLQVVCNGRRLAVVSVRPNLLAVACFILSRDILVEPSYRRTQSEVELLKVTRSFLFYFLYTSLCYTYACI